MSFLSRIMQTMKSISRKIKMELLLNDITSGRTRILCFDNQITTDLKPVLQKQLVHVYLPHTKI